METEGRFDFIVVGGGSAGCALAVRLSESGKHQVLLLEAGPVDRDPWIHVPIGYAKLFSKKSVNWLYEAEPGPEWVTRNPSNPRTRKRSSTTEASSGPIRQVPAG